MELTSGWRLPTAVIPIYSATESVSIVSHCYLPSPALGVEKAKASFRGTCEPRKGVHGASGNSCCRRESDTLSHSKALIEEKDMKV